MDISKNNKLVRQYTKTKFRTKIWVELNDESRGTYHVNSQTKFKTSMLRSSLCDYSEAFILVSSKYSSTSSRSKQ